jgi:hypothetical protein
MTPGATRCGLQEATRTLVVHWKHHQPTPTYPRSAIKGKTFTYFLVLETGKERRRVEQEARVAGARVAGASVVRVARVEDFWAEEVTSVEWEEVEVTWVADEEAGIWEEVEVTWVAAAGT